MRFVKLLALDSATEACSAALLVDGALSEQYAVIGRGHADRLLPMADTLLAGAGVTISQLDAVAFGRGPGSFTGLRIAAGIAQGLAAGAARPIISVSDLAALAAGGARLFRCERILACLDARMGQVYWAAFDCSSGQPAALTDERLSDPAEVRLPDGGPWAAVGHGLAAYPELAARLQAQFSGSDPSLLPRASDIAHIAAADLAAGKAVPAALAQPIYLRDEVVHRR